MVSSDGLLKQNWIIRRGLLCDDLVKCLERPIAIHDVFGNLKSPRISTFQFQFQGVMKNKIMNKGSFETLLADITWYKTLPVWYERTPEQNERCNQRFLSCYKDLPNGHRSTLEEMLARRDDGWCHWLKGELEVMYAEDDLPYGESEEEDDAVGWAECADKRFAQRLAWLKQMDK